MVPSLAVKLAKLNEDEIKEHGLDAPIFQKLSNAAGATTDPNQMLFKMFPKVPPPLLMMLIGGLTSAGIGYGGATLASRFFPGWDKRKMQRTGTLGGLALGAMPGLLIGLNNLNAGESFNHNWLNTAPRSGFKPHPRPPVPQAIPGQRATAPLPPPYDPKNPPSVQYQSDFANMKKASFMTGIGTFPPVDVDAFNRVVWKDPYVANKLDPAMRAAATGAVTSAANLPGKRPGTRWVTPMDMGRIAAGMGSGYVSGALVGATLGTLMGMPTETQNTLRRTGMYAGIVANVIPKLFGG
jgi:hypothetical protein